MTNFPNLIARYRVCFAVIVVIVLTTSAQRAYSEEPGPLNFAYSYSVFALDDTSSLVELDYQYSEKGLTYEKVEGRHVGRLLVSLQIWDSTGRMIVSSGWITSSARPDKGEDDHALLGVKLFGVRPGHHKAQIAYEDAGNPSRRDSAKFDLTVRKFGRGSIALSDVQVINEIAPSTDEANRFYKNGYIIYPNVLSTIEPPFLLLNTYLEVYNADTSPSSQFEITYGLATVQKHDRGIVRVGTGADSNFRLIYQKDEMRDRPASSAIIEVQSMILEELPSGTYYLLVKTYAGLRGTAKDSALVIRAFNVINPDKDSALAQSRSQTANGGTLNVPIDPIYAGLTEDELNREFLQFKYLTIESDKHVWEKLTGADAKARFLTEFWFRRDPDPGTMANELREEYLGRIQAANKMYREPMIDHGYQSDRGRALLKYGKPDQIERNTMEPNRKAHEIWLYSKDNAQFVFVDKSGLGKYVLVHSTVTGEPKEDNWVVRHATIHENFDR